MPSFSDLVTIVNGYAWGIPMVVLLVGGGLYLMLRSRGLPLLGAVHAIAILRGKYDNADDPGEITHFQALTTALSSTVGVGNIAGVAVAISQGGPGAIFWMWIAAIVGMTTKFFTCTLACMYRKVDEAGIAQGGPMYTIELGLGRRFRPLAIFFSVFGLVGCLGMFQANQLAEVMEANYGVDPRVTAVAMVCVVGAVILGGLHRIARLSEKLVPAMCAIYILTSLCVLAMRIELLPGVLLTIVQDAFTFQAATGGAVGTVIIVGVKRAAFSNEAGVGTAPMAHGAAKTKEPVREGLVAMLGPLIDTLVICTMTALVILSSDESLLGAPLEGDVAGVSLTSQAFESTLGTAGSMVVTLSVVLFAMTTMFGYSYYGRKCLSYLVGQQRGKVYNYAYLASLGVAALGPAALVIDVLDTAFALMALPNMIATLILAPRVVDATKDYFARQMN